MSNEEPYGSQLNQYDFHSVARKRSEELNEQVQVLRTQFANNARRNQ